MAQATEESSQPADRPGTGVLGSQTATAGKGTRMSNEPNEEDRLDWQESQEHGARQVRRTDWALLSLYGAIVGVIVLVWVLWHYWGHR